MSGSLRIVLDGRATTTHFPGVARATLGLLTGLREIEHDHRIAVLSHGNAPPPTHPAFQDHRFSRIATHALPLSLAQQWQLPLLSRVLRPDVWHAPYYVRPFLGVPRPVVTVFDVIGRVVPGALPSLRARLLFEMTLRLSLRSAVQIITSSEATKRDLIATYQVVESRLKVVALAADAQFQPQSVQKITGVREKYGLPSRYILYVGSNKPHKNLVSLVRAFAALDTDAALVIAGHWDRRYPEAMSLAQSLNIADRVRFIHEIADADLPPLLSSAEVFVFPSRYEGFGLPPLEAMACGAPVIVANTSALPEVVGDAGLLVVPEPKLLAEAMQTVLDDPSLRMSLRERGLNRARQFSWAETARQTLHVYEQV